MILHWLYEVVWTPVGRYAFLLICAGVLAAFLFGAVSGNGELFSAACLGIGCVIALGAVARKVTFYELITWTAFTALVSSVFYLLLQFTLSAKEKKRLRRLQREELRRQLIYTLPEKDNSFIRERLNTVLQSEPSAVPETESSLQFSFGYAKKLTAKLKEAPLSLAERVQADEMAKAFALCEGKNRWSAEDARRLNDTFSALLKLSAKYNV